LCLVSSHGEHVENSVGDPALSESGSRCDGRAIRCDGRAKPKP